MKTKLTSLLVALVAFALASCSSDDEPDNSGLIVDYVPIDMVISVVDADGNNLLDPSNSRNILAEPMTLTYQGEITEVKIFPERYPQADREESRHIPAFWNGAAVKTPDFMSEGIYLVVGDWDVHTTEASVVITIRGVDYEFSFKNSYKKNKKTGIYDFDRNFYMNGKLADRGLKIVL